MTQHRPKVPTNLTMVLLLALIATPLTIDQRGGVGINQASAQSGHSVSRAEAGEGSARDKAADAGQAKQDAAPIRLLLRNQDSYATYELAYHDGLKYPQLERVPGATAYLNVIIAPMK